jgi:hypothetical protein
MQRTTLRPASRGSDSPVEGFWAAAARSSYLEAALSDTTGTVISTATATAA